MKREITDNWQRKYCKKYRTKRVFSLFPFIFVNGIELDIVYTGKWFKYVTIRQQKVKDRYLEFDDGWSYKNYWGPWETNWIFTELLNE